MGKDSISCFFEEVEDFLNRIAGDKAPSTAINTDKDSRSKAIEAWAKREKAIILWLDQTGLRSGAAVGTTWAPVGQTPVVAGTGKRRSISMVSAVSPRGELRLQLGREIGAGPVQRTRRRRRQQQHLRRPRRPDGRPARVMFVTGFRATGSSP